MTWWTQLITVAHPDPHTRRRGRLLAMVLLALLVLAVVFIPVSLFGPTPLLSMITIGACIALFATSLALTHRGMVTGAGWLFILTVVLAITVSTGFGSPIPSVFFLVLAVITASLVLPPAQSWWVMLVAFGGMGTAAVLRPSLFAEPEQLTTLIFAALLLIAATFLAVLGARAMEQALLVSESNARTATAAQGQAEEQAREVAIQAKALRRAEEQLHALVATLETPTVALADGVLLAPLIGTIDSRRAQTLTDRLLRDIAARRVQLLILDIAGVSLIDTAVAHTLIQITQAVRLLGARVVLTGVAPTVAVTLTHLGTDLGGMETARSPQEVLAARTPAANGSRTAVT